MNILQHLPFSSLTNVEFIETVQNTTNYFSELLTTHNLSDLISKYLPDNPQYDVNCNYYHESKFTQVFKKSSPKFSLYHQNIRSFPKHRLELQTFLYTLDVEFDILALTEIGKNNTETCAAFLKDYELYHDKASSKCGGAALLVRKNVEFITERHDLHIKGNDNDNTDIENIWIEIKVPSIKKPIIVGCIYRHPRGNVKYFTCELEKTIQKLSQEDKLCFICGDLNINPLQTHHEPTEGFINAILSHNVIPHITLPTRLTDHSATLIDHILVKHDKYTAGETLLSGNIFNDISDHLPNFILYGKGSHGSPKERPKIRMYGSKNFQNFRNYLNTLSWPDDTSNADCNELYTQFIENVETGFNTCFPLQPLSRKREKDKKWITQGLKKSSLMKNRLYRAYIKNPTVQRKEKYKRYKNMFERLCRQAEIDYVSDLIGKTKQNLRTMWKTFGPIVNPSKHRCNKNKVDRIIYDNRVVTDSQAIAETFNDYFIGIGKTLAKKMPRITNYKKYLGEANTSSMFMIPATKQEVKKEIEKLHLNKSPGPDLIPAKVIKVCADQIVEPLTTIINSSFQTGVFPSKLKIAKVIPIFKKKDRHTVGNYRPISLLSIFGKVLEKLMHHRLYSFLNKCNILYELQFGFRTNHSTSLALIDIVERIRQTLDNQLPMLGIYLDLQKAFDTVDHQILLSKLSHYGIRGICNQWFSSYLRGRKQFVSVNNTCSEIKEIETGVPQGSVLGPLLFLLYVNDISRAIREEGVVAMLFADDTNIFVQGKNLVTVKKLAEQVMKQLSTWFYENKLSLSIEKTQFSIFHKRGTKIPEECNKLCFDTEEIRRVDQSKYLGVILDDRLSWEPHIKTTLENLVKTANSLKVISPVIPNKCKKELYYAYVYSRIKYGIEVYGLATITRLKSIQVMQNRILKILFNIDWFCPTNSLHKNLNIIQVKDIFLL